MPKTDTRLVAIDVGSAKVGVLIVERAEMEGEPGLKVVGVGKAPNRGTLKGHIVNIDATVKSLRRATEEAETMAGTEISRAFVGVGGSDLRSANSHGTAYVDSGDRGISRADIDLVLNAARDVPLPPDREILHAIPQEFAVDDHGGIADPQGMLGSRLEAKVHLVMGHAPRTRTLVRCLNEAGVEAAEVVFEPLATAEAVLLPDERELGVLLLEIGSGTCGFAFYHQSEVQHSGVLPFGASHFTADLASVLRTSFAGAETLKLRHGCCLPGLVDGGEGVNVPTVGGGASRTIERAKLAEILQARAEEMFHLVQVEMEKAGCADQLRGGVVLTGGGSKLAGLPELAQQFFSSDARYGVPLGLTSEIEGLTDPSWATAAGLVRYAIAEEQARLPLVRQGSVRGVRGVMGSLRQMFNDLL
ncbi:MAG: cell division protein FtsA [Acidobacteria bacterium]|nr:cell division protein FtsA [Acidobacteriota bacterium]MCY3966533.1 cell division protein FtsA [Acidobacteriota bacterium]